MARMDFNPHDLLEGASLVLNRTTLAVFMLLWCVGLVAMAQTTGSIQGSVTDSSSAPIWGAVVVVEGADGHRFTTVTDVEGFFKILSLPLGDYGVKISANGMADWTAPNVAASVMPNASALVAVLQVAPEITKITGRAAARGSSRGAVERAVETAGAGRHPEFLCQL